jgi:hypothetical protein
MALLPNCCCVLQVLFYTRMLSDILGRLLPRKKALAITSPAALLALSGALLLCSVAFFVYLQVRCCYFALRQCSNTIRWWLIAYHATALLRCCCVQ